ncbi:Beta-galactosidase C-terminal domain [Jeotgalibaca porci]
MFVMNFGTDEETITFEDEVIDLITGEKVARKITLNGYGVRVFKKI